MSIMTKIRECLINEIAKGILIANAVVNLRGDSCAMVWSLNGEGCSVCQRSLIHIHTQTANKRVTITTAY